MLLEQVQVKKLVLLIKVFTTVAHTLKSTYSML